MVVVNLESVSISCIQVDAALRDTGRLPVGKVEEVIIKKRRNRKRKRKVSNPICPDINESLSCNGKTHSVVRVAIPEVSCRGARNNITTPDDGETIGIRLRGRKEGGKEGRKEGKEGKEGGFYSVE